MADIEELLELHHLDDKVVVSLQRELLHAHLGTSLGQHFVHLRFEWGFEARSEEALCCRACFSFQASDLSFSDGSAVTISN